jgi:uncharacterized protein HemY
MFALVLVVLLFLGVVAASASTTNQNYLPIVFTSPLPTRIPTLTAISEMATPIP